MSPKREGFFTKDSQLCHFFILFLLSSSFSSSSTSCLFYFNTHISPYLFSITSPFSLILQFAAFLPMSTTVFPSHKYSHPPPFITITHFNTAFYSQHIYFCSVMSLCSSFLTPIFRATVQQVSSVNGGAFGDKACSFASGCCLLCN